MSKRVKIRGWYYFRYKWSTNDYSLLKYKSKNDEFYTNIYEYAGSSKWIHYTLPFIEKINDIHITSEMELLMYL